MERYRSLFVVLVRLLEEFLVNPVMSLRVVGTLVHGGGERVRAMVVLVRVLELVHVYALLLVALEPEFDQGLGLGLWDPLRYREGRG